MVTHDNVQRRAALIVAVRGQAGALTVELDEKVWLAIRASSEGGPAALSMARLNGLAESLAWHERRQSPAPRLEAFGRELARLLRPILPRVSRADPPLEPVLPGVSRADLPLYEYLLLRLWRPFSEAPPATQIEQVLKDLAIDHADQKRWRTFLGERWNAFPVGEYERRVLAGLPIPVVEQARWAEIARLALARTAMQIALGLANADGLRQAIESEGGALLWQ